MKFGTDVNLLSEPEQIFAKFFLWGQKSGRLSVWQVRVTASLGRFHNNFSSVKKVKRIWKNDSKDLKMF